ncbi:helical backbone metal receptor [Sphingomonas sp. S1-29]|uniref:ABC transporter substrate-binding protein n=1 Tax=Sphingomonas sp. S1-29 TaxID=2991074 RepID=UPI002240056D|nr:helical backbone metal receptor [Sphingomonas sp. S1-29]UZK69327.1 helical backbone metal receptor [Sphingomonas sp. S1-29]
MKRAGLLAALLCVGAAPAPVPLRVVSINPCADSVLMRVADRGQIAAVSHYSHDPEASSIPVEIARRFKATSGTAEEVVALAPDVVLSGRHVARSTILTLRRMGVRLVQLDVPTTIAESVAQVRLIADTVGRPERGAVLAEAIERSVRAAKPADSRAIPALIWQGGGLVPGTDTLSSDMLRAGGFRNLSADYGLKNWDILPLERLVAKPPRMLLTVGEGEGAGDRRLSHPVLRPLARHMTRAAWPERLMHCGGPTIVDAMTRLRAIRSRLPAA